MLTINRRRFLTSLTALGVAATAHPFLRAHAAEALKRRFKIELNCGAIGVRADGREAIALAHRYGFEAVAPSPGFLAKLSADELQSLQAEMKEKRLFWGSAGLPVNFRADDATFRTGLKELPEFAKTLQRAGAGRVGTWLSPSHANLDFASNFRLHSERLREIAKVLADHSQRLGIEYVGPKTSRPAGKQPFIHTMAEARKLIAAINHPNVGLMLDSWHWYTAHETEADLLALSNSDIVACHLNDAPAGVPVDEQLDGKRELPCATGVIDVKVFLDALVKIGYDGPVCAEPFSKKLAAMAKDEAVKTVAEAMKKAAL